MYYSPNQPPPTISSNAGAPYDDFAPVIKKKKLRLYAVLGVIAVGLVGIVWWYGQIQIALDQAQPAEVVEATPTPAGNNDSAPQVAGVTFGDLLSKKRDYNGWLAGIKDGSIIIMNPESGELNTLFQATDEWHGPISSLIWSPDYTKLAFIMMPESEADGFSQDPVAQVKRLGLESVPSANAFPYGYVAILDTNTKQLTRTNVEVRNLPQNIVWRNETTLLALNTTLHELTLSDMKVAAITAAGVSDETTQLLPPMVWHNDSQTIYFTQVKHTKSNSVRKIVSLNLKDNKLEEHNLIREGDQETVMISRGLSLAISPDSSMLGYISDDGVGYISLTDGGDHPLPYSDDRLWMRESELSNVQWIGSEKLGFESMSSDGSKVWGVWDTASNKVHTFGRGSLAASWNQASGRLALLLSSGNEVGILTPDWQKPEESGIELLSLPWTAVVW